MNDRLICWVLTCLLILIAAKPVSSQVPPPPATDKLEAPAQHTHTIEKNILSRVSLVNTFVTVMNAKGKLVFNLDAKDFQVTDDGEPQKITSFDFGNVPNSLVILMETSSRIEPLLSDMHRTGIIFANSVMGPDDEAAVVGFNDSLDYLSNFTTNHAVIQSTVEHLEAGTSGSKLLDAVAAGLQMLIGHLQQQRAAGLPERHPVIVIMAEATDFGSDAQLARVLREAQLSSVTIYSVGIPTTLAELTASPRDVRPRTHPDGVFALPAMPGTAQIQPSEDIRNGYGNLMNLNVWALRNARDAMDGHALNIATSGTGGRHIATFGGRSLEKATDEIGAELHSQYWLTYEPKGTEETGYHSIKVYVHRKGLKVRARPGYYIAPSEN